MGRPASPADQTAVWLTYAYQQAGDWTEAESVIAASPAQSKAFFSAA